MNFTTQHRDKPLSLLNLSQQQIAERLQPVGVVCNSSSNPSSYSTVSEKKATERPRPSAVLLPLLWRDDQWHILLIRRSESVSHHKGQVAFPGGCWENSDNSLLETALRETREELGETVCPVKILGSLPSVTTNSTGYIIYPFVALLEDPLFLEPDAQEVADVFTLPLTVFTTPSRTEPVEFDSDNINIWGATARITEQFIQYLKHGELL